MKLIIDIPKANYEKMKIMDEKGTLENPYLMAIAQGTPLPKGHGRLIDADELIEGKVANDWTRIQAECANTIIEADKAGEVIEDIREKRIDRCMYCKEMFDLYCAKAKKNVPYDKFWTPPYKPEWCPGRTPADEYRD